MIASSTTNFEKECQQWEEGYKGLIKNKIVTFEVQKSLIWKTFNKTTDTDVAQRFLLKKKLEILVQARETHYKASYCLQLWLWLTRGDMETSWFTRDVRKAKRLLAKITSIVTEKIPPTALESRIIKLMRNEIAILRLGSLWEKCPDSGKKSTINSQKSKDAIGIEPITLFTSTNLVDYGLTEKRIQARGFSLQENGDICVVKKTLLNWEDGALNSITNYRNNGEIRAYTKFKDINMGGLSTKRSIRQWEGEALTYGEPFFQFIALSMASERSKIQEINADIKHEVQILKNNKISRATKIQDHFAIRKNGHVFYCLISDFPEHRNLWEFLRETNLHCLHLKKMLLQATNTLSEAHKCRCIHRNVNPYNILVYGDDINKIYGVSLNTLELSIINWKLTVSNTEGTSMYLAPEYIEAIRKKKNKSEATSQAITEKIDIWSLGATFFEALFGCPFAVFLIHKKEEWQAFRKEDPREAIQQCIANYAPKFYQFMTEKTKIAHEQAYPKAWIQLKKRMLKNRCSLKAQLFWIIVSMLNPNPKERPTAKQVRKLVEKTTLPPIED